MPRYIDADKLKETLKDLQAEGYNREYVRGLQAGIDGFFPQIIDDEPTADVEPVRHGRWTHAIEDYARCSVCKKHEENVCAIFYEYCPNCGAKMDGGDEK